MRIDARSSDPAAPYNNLSPIVDLLVKAGNATSDGGFILNPDGWRCRMRRRLDFDLVTEAFELPPTIRVSRVHDSILDTLTWCSIEGQGSR